MDIEKLNSIAVAMVADNKGLLAADESTGTIAKRLASIDVESTEDNRRDYRELLFRAKGSGEYVSGAILYDETIRQSAKDGTKLVDVMKAEGII
ncbi:MAG: class I fructose-bisphosphate aldolase, partial [Rhodospirillales bacterium]